MLREHWPHADSENASWVFRPNPGQKHTALLYVHTGGLEGLASQLGRYRRLGLLAPGEEEEEGVKGF